MCSKPLPAAGVAIPCLFAESPCLQLFLEEPQWIDKVTKAHSHMTGMSKLEAWRQFLNILGSRPYGTSSFPPEQSHPSTALLGS